jgi:hypothetical protein
MGIRAIAFLLVALLAGFFCLSAWAPATDAEKGKTETSTGMTTASEKDDTPGVQEQEQPPAKIAKKHFPWFCLVAGAVVVGVVLYFTVIKKPEYKLTVAVGTGVSGTPASGVTFYKKGKRIDYSYKFEATYKNLRVYLDGVAVPAAGQIKMDRHHTLAAYADESYFDLTVTTTAGVSGTPAAGTYTHREGTSVAYNYADTSGYTNLRVQVDGVDVPAQGTLLMDRAHTLMVMAELISPCTPSKGEYWSITFVSDTGKRTNSTLYFINFLPVTSTSYQGSVELSGGYVVMGYCEVTLRIVFRLTLKLLNYGDGYIRMDCEGMNCTNGIITGEYTIWPYTCDGCGGSVYERGTFTTRRQ